MKRTDEIFFLKDIFNSLSKIFKYTENMSYEDFILIIPNPKRLINEIAIIASPAPAPLGIKIEAKSKFFID